MLQELSTKSKLVFWMEPLKCNSNSCGRTSERATVLSILITELSLRPSVIREKLYDVDVKASLVGGLILRLPEIRVSCGSQLIHLD